MQDRRSHARFRADGSVVLKTAGPDSRDVVARLVNLSFKGIGVSAEVRIERGARVAIELVDVPPLKGRIALGNGEVVNVAANTRASADAFRISVRFINSDHGLIQRLLLSIQRQHHAQARNRVSVSGAPSKRSGVWL